MTRYLTGLTEDTTEYKRKSRKLYNKSKVEVRLDELDLIMKAAKRCLEFAIANDTFLGSGLTVEDKEMASAYKSMNEYLINIREKAQTTVDKILKKKAGVK